MTLMNVFDLFDFDESGTLCRNEFDIYNTLASDEHVTDQEWDILCRNFQTKDGGLLLNSFIALHQVEADHDRSMEDTWISLLSIGYNDRLDLVHVSIHNLLTLIIRTDAIFQSVRSHRCRERELLGQDLESYATCSQRWGILPKTTRGRSLLR
ncbi:unnamed protein product [Gongylonema pulchrum]|uniref:EF-hand domain-containing protein n=1 Tax=Gongylonema pulchrum TaxID=637853 RepID=A0A183EJJ9_9BILA|nr:unnamed protein product [Gongylonema pulchrum]